MRMLLYPALFVGFICLSACLSAAGSANQLKPFTTDGCSLWIDGTPQNANLWRHCCVAHDFSYWLGGSKTERKQADEEMLACVKQAQEPLVAEHMYLNVRWGGSPYWMNHYRWGYGWNYFDGFWPRGYKVPTADEQALIEQAMPAALQLVADDAIYYPRKPTEGEAQAIQPD